MNTKNTIIAIVVIVLVGLGIYYISKPSSQTSVPNTPSGQQTGTNPITPVTVSTTTPSQHSNAPEESIGTSVQGRDITAYHFGTGSDEILFVGGIHGGYEWNTALVAYQLVDYLKANPSAVPANEKITVIPDLNPDGLAKVTGVDGKFAASDVNPSSSVQVAGRFNANTVDLNRNFDCDWQAKGVWQNRAVSGGTGAFSEPESVAVRNYIQSHNLSAAVVWYSSAGGVYSSSCDGSVMPSTAALAKAFANASGYPAFADFDSYQVTGDMVNWLAKMQIPAISVLLTDHTSTEWSKNLAGIKAVIKSYAK